MSALIDVNWWSLVLALLIGLATGWWLWVWQEPERWDQDEEWTADYPDHPVSETSLVATVSEDEPVERPDAFMTTPPPSLKPAFPVLAFAAAGAKDDLTMLRGIGPKIADILNGIGVTRFSQIARWTEQDIAEVDPILGGFSGRIVREEWIDQAKLLAAGDMEEFAAKYGDAVDAPPTSES
jgi:predicted flap endonuclease-1-like 5' DNA nuclease